MNKNRKQQQIETAFHLNGLVFIDVSTPKHPNSCMVCDEPDYIRWKECSRCGRIYTWRTKTSTYPYACFTYDGHVKCFHRFVMECDQNTDHINRNGLDNTRNNLRNVSHSINGWNRTKQSNNTTGYKGVYYRAERNKFKAYINLNKKRRTLGYFESAEEAHNRYKLAESRRWAGLPIEEL